LGVEIFVPRWMPRSGDRASEVRPKRTRIEAICRPIVNQQYGKAKSP
jgi:hypothetical protein